jgi:hypothetical protein
MRDHLVAVVDQLLEQSSKVEAGALGAASSFSFEFQEQARTGSVDRCKSSTKSAVPAETEGEAEPQHRLGKGSTADQVHRRRQT